MHKWHRLLHRQHLLAGARAEGDTVGTRGSLRRPERAGVVRVGVAVDHVRRALLLNQRAESREQLQDAGDDVCNRACSASSLGAATSTKIGSPSVHLYMPSSTRQCKWMFRLAADPQRDRQRPHPLAHRHMADDMVDQLRCGLRPAAGAARRAEASPLAAEGDQFVVATVAAAQP